MTGGSRWWWHPGFRFLALGVLLFVARSAFDAWAAPAGMRDVVDERAVVITQTQIEALVRDFEGRWGQSPSPVQLAAAVGEAIDDALLEREAARLALATGDVLVRHRLVSKMRILSTDPAADEETLLRHALALGLDDDIVIKRHLRQQMRVRLERDDTAAPLTDELLRSALARHRHRFETPAQVRFDHVFIRRGDDADAARRRADALAARVAADALTPRAATRLSDPFPIATAGHVGTRATLTSRFGTMFGERVMALDAGVWSPPIPSAFGWHLVWVHEHRPAALPSLASVRPALVRLVVDERAATRLRSALARLRARYAVWVDWPASAGVA